MTKTILNSQIAILDTGGQYCHLIARKVRELGVYAEVLPSETPAERLRDHKGVIISGGPASVYAQGSPQVDDGLFQNGPSVLGICYGQHVLARALGGEVRRGFRGEYGLATLELVEAKTGLFRGAEKPQQIWMSHRDTVERVPTGFSVLARTDTCAIAAMADPDRRLYGVQFHPEVVQTENGQQILRNWLFDICGCEKDWYPRDRVAAVEAQVREQASGRSVFFFVSGGVDSTVAFTLCLRALGEDSVSGFYVDTGLMREGETAYVRQLFKTLGTRNFMVEEAGDQFLSALEGVCDPEKKRLIIGKQFVEVQDRILRTGHFLDSNWVLGQGTIYPDTIESGGSAKADLIKTHHNRVEGIQTLIREGRIVEPLSWFYKDEVREIGRELGLPPEFLDRHPFPGPGLAIRCLCSATTGWPSLTDDGWLIPVSSVGVQGDCRSYRPILCIEGSDLHNRATALTNKLDSINRVITPSGLACSIDQMEVRPATLSSVRLALLRHADHLVREMSKAKGFEHQVWQFPIILVPFGLESAPNSIVLRPIQSVDGMTAEAVSIPPEMLTEMTQMLMRLPVAGVFVDLTHKPPGTIEWE